MKATLILLAGGIILTIGDIFMKKWVNTQTHTWYIIGLIIYIIGMNFLAQSYRYKNIAVASVIFVIFNIITLAIVSRLYFKESLSPLQIIGVITGIAAVILLELG